MVQAVPAGLVQWFPAGLLGRPARYGGSPPGPAGVAGPVRRFSAGLARAVQSGTGVLRRPAQLKTSVQYTSGTVPGFKVLSQAL